MCVEELLPMSWFVPSVFASGEHGGRLEGMGAAAKYLIHPNILDDLLLLLASGLIPRSLLRF